MCIHVQYNHLFLQTSAHVVSEGMPVLYQEYTSDTASPYRPLGA